VTSTSSDAEGILRPFPIQVDGDYIGEATAIELRVAPGALTVVA
jgi:diacylglycerol kinase family enzyme